MGDCSFYDPDQLTIVLSGIIIDSGFAEDEFVSIEQNSQDFEMVVGALGDVTRSKTNDKTATITLTLMQKAKVNTALSVLNNLDKKSANGAGVGPLLIKDRSGTALYAASKAWIAKPPDGKFAKKAGQRAWMIHVANLERLDGA